MKDEAEALDRQAAIEIAGRYLGNPSAGTALERAIFTALRAARESGARDMRERAAVLMEGGANKPGSFTAGAGFCRLTDHCQEMCECAERADGIRALPLDSGSEE